MSSRGRHLIASHSSHLRQLEISLEGLLLEAPAVRVALDEGEQQPFILFVEFPPFNGDVVFYFGTIVFLNTAGEEHRVNIR